MCRAAALAGFGAWECDLADDRLSWTDAVYDMFGLCPSRPAVRAEMIGQYSEESRELLERVRSDAIRRCRPMRIDAEIVRTDGARRWLRLTGDVVVRGGRAVRLYGLKQDVTDERLRWDAMRRMAEQDALTGLANRALFQNRFLDTASVRPLGALLLLDLDGFKQVNDRLGHDAGDACLRAAAERLATGFADAEMVARIGGDEFAVLLHADGADGDRLERRVARYLAALGVPIPWNGRMLEVRGSIGIARPDDPWRYDPEAVFAAADAALYAVKAAGRNGYRVAERGVPAELGRQRA